MNHTSLLALLSLLILSSSSVFAQDIVHDAEYYILQKQNIERWSSEDNDLDRRLAEFKKSNDGKAPEYILHPDRRHRFW